MGPDLDEQDPIRRFEHEFRRARDAGIHLPEAMSLATATPSGVPSVRVVLLKEFSHEGFVFYTNLQSRKVVELQANPRASLCFWWGTLEIQVRIEGPSVQVTDAEADAYFATRPRGSQLGAWASDQSRPLASHEALLARVAAVEARYEGKAVPRPAHWSGLRVAPEQIEFWYGRPDRLHQRVTYTRRDGGWVMGRLFP